MKILSVNQIREADAFTIEQEPVSSAGLMERAAAACVEWITERYGAEHTFSVFCGTGNNGGDGLVIARLLSAKNYPVNVFIIGSPDKGSKDFSENYQRIQGIQTRQLKIAEIKTAAELKPVQDSIIVDALLGTGVSRLVEGLLKDAVNVINNSSSIVISVDVPSGLYCDKLNDGQDVIVKADFTLTFQFPKLSFMFVETAKYVGAFSILDIGLHPDYIHNTQTKEHFITKEDILSFFKTRDRTAHKGNFGHALLAAGSYGKIGAAELSAKACMRTGVGLLTLRLPKCGYEILQVALPEAMVDVDEEERMISGTIKTGKYNAIGIGPGIGMEKETQNALKLLIQNTAIPVVFDADAINILAENKTWLSFVPRNSIFTPHLGEFERLTGKADNSEERLKQQREFALKYNCYVVLKGAHTSVCGPDGIVFFNSTGNPGMATGGSGDVLTGMITSLLAQGYHPLHACILGVYLHGLAGDLAAAERSEESMLASDIIEFIPAAYKFLRS